LVINDVFDAAGQGWREPASEQCKACGRGSFAAKYGAKFCESCPQGTFARNAGQAWCEQCPLGFTTWSEQSTSCDGKRLDLVLNVHVARWGSLDGRQGRVYLLIPVSLNSGQWSVVSVWSVILLKIDGSTGLCLT